MLGFRPLSQVNNYESCLHCTTLQRILRARAHKHAHSHIFITHVHKTCPKEWSLKQMKAQFSSGTHDQHLDQVPIDKPQAVRKISWRAARNGLNFSPKALSKRPLCIEMSCRDSTP